MSESRGEGGGHGCGGRRRGARSAVVGNSGREAGRKKCGVQGGRGEAGEAVQAPRWRGMQAGREVACRHGARVRCLPPLPTGRGRG